MGFNSQVAKTEEDNKVLQEVQPEDLLKFGLIPELIGRLPVVVSLDPLSKEALIKILTEPKNALVKQYETLFKMDGVELEMTDKALERIAEKAAERKTGARGLRSITEKLMTDIMYEIPSNKDIKKVIITDSTVDGGEPEIILKSGETKTA